MQVLLSIVRYKQIRFDASLAIQSSLKIDQNRILLFLLF